MSPPVGGAHLTSPTATLRPSIFEVLAHQGFASALKPAVNHVIKVLAEHNPTGNFATVYRYFDELYLAFDAVVQWHYILTRGATLSEAFYGLERNVTANDHKLHRIRLSYLSSVLLPYVNDKLEKIYKQATDPVFNSDSDSQFQNDKHKELIKKKAVLLYPYLKTVLRAVNLLYLLGYTFGRSDHPSLTFKLIKMTLGYTSEERSRFLEDKNAELLTLSEWTNIRNTPKLLLRSLGESVLWMVELGTFAIQFLDWWNHDQQRSRITLSSQPIPPAPHALSKSSSKKVQSFVDLLPSDMNKCPLCRNEFRNPTCISVTGVVYCYGCIFAYLKQQSKCPLTNVPCNNNHLIRVYR